MADNEYPKMLYKYPAETPFYSELQDGSRYDTIIVDSAEEEEGAVKEGFFLTSPEAKEVGSKAVVKENSTGWK